MAAPFTLEGRTVLISGASSGIGARFAEICAGAGGSVVLAARRLDRSTSSARRLRDQGLRATAVAMDVTDESSIIAAYDEAERVFGIVDTVIANAGINAGGRSTEVPASDIRAVLETNLLGAYLTAREGARRMIAAGSREREQGRIILIGSITATMTGQGDAAYCASKAGLATLGRNFAREWVRQGINVNVLQPGYMQTDIMGDWFNSEAGKQQIQGFHRRRLLEPRALDDMVLYLASDASRAITGATFDIDDGQSL